MQLADYLAQENIEPVDFAKLIRVEPITVGRYCRGERIPNQETMAAIVRHTDGAVLPNDFYETPRPAKRTRRRRSEKKAV